MDPNSIPNPDSPLPSENARRALEARYRLIVEHAAEGIWTVDTHYRTDYVNPRGAEILGYAPAELLGHSPVEFLIPEDRPLGQAAIEETARGGVTEREYRLCRKDGSTRWVHSSTRPLYDASGSYSGSIGIFQDITEHKRIEEELRRVNADLEHRIAERTAELERANEELTCEIEERKKIEEALRHSEQQANDLIRHAPTAIYEIDFRGPRFLRVNDAMCRMSGYTREELLGKSPFALLDEESRRLFSERIRKTFAGEPIDETVAYRALVKDGREVFTILQTRMIFQNGKPVGAFVIAHDVTERKRAADALRQRTQEMQAIMEAVPVAVFVTRDPDARTIVGNRAARDLVALPPDANMSKSAPDDERPTGWQEMRHGVPIAPEDLPLQQAARGIEIRGYEMDLVFRDGTTKSVAGNATPLRDENGNPQGGVAVLEDVTERKRAREETQRLYRDLQLKSEEQQRANVRLEEHSEQLRVANLQSEERSIELEQENIGTEQVLTQERLARAEAEIGQNILSTLMGYAPGVLILADAPDMNIRMISRYAEDLFQRSHDELVGVPGPDHPLRRDLFKPDGVTPIPYDELPIVRAVSLGESTFDYEILVRRAQGDPVAVLAGAAPVRDTQGQVVGAIAVWTDITARRHAEQERTRLQGEVERRATELEMAYRELESFTYSVSHDLRTPLATIDSLAQMLLQDYGAQNADLDRHLRLIRLGTQQMKDLIESLLNLSRLTRHNVRKDRVSMTALATQALETLHQEPSRQNLTIDIQPMPDALADPVLVKQVWVNLLSNALKFTRKCENARVEIGCMPADGEEHAYYVRDNGVGFDPNQADRLFGVFQRLHGEDEYEGTGVGLAIVQRIIRRHGGRVWAEGEEGKGATFYFTLGQ